MKASFRREDVMSIFTAEAEKVARTIDPDGDWHCHQDHPDGRYRHAQDPVDICETIRFEKKDYYSIVDCGDTLYAVVVEDLSLVRKLKRSSNLASKMDLPPWNTLDTAGLKRKKNRYGSIKRSCW